MEAQISVDKREKEEEEEEEVVFFDQIIRRDRIIGYLRRSLF